MKKMKHILTLGFSVLLLQMTTACNRQLPTAATSAVAQADDNNYQAPDTGYYPEEQPQQNFAPAPMQNYQAPRNEIPNQIIDTFKVDQDFFHQWHAVGVIAINGKTYVAASDNGGIKKMGTVIEMTGAGGKKWKDYGSNFLSLSHPMKSSISGITSIGSRILTIDLEGNLFSIDNGKIRKQNGTPGKDIAAGGNAVYIATLSGSVERMGSELAAGTPVPQVRLKGGIGADKLGNLFAVADLGIAKVTPMGQPQLVIPREQLKEPLDVAVDNRNGDIYVLDGAFVKRFDTNGQLLSTMGSSTSKPNSIALDETGKVYVTDFGQNFRDSKVVVFSAAKLSAPAVQANNFGAPQYNQPAPQYNYNNQPAQSYGQPQTRAYSAPQYGSYNTAPQYNQPASQYGYGTTPQYGANPYGQQGYGQQGYGYNQTNRRQY